MKNLYVLTKFSFREALSRKIFLAFAGISTFVILIFLLLFMSVDIEGFQMTFKVEGEDLFVLSKIVETIQTIITIPLYAGGLFLSIFSASSFIPHLLEKGNIDLFLSKPVRRYELILSKFIGGTVMVFFNIAYIVLAVWLLIGLKFDVWNFSFLMTIPITTFSFAVLYSLMIFIGIMTRSSILAMMITYLIHFVLSPVLYFREEIFIFITSEVVTGFFNLMYYLIPRTQELAMMNTNLARDTAVESWSAVINAFIFMLAALAGSVLIFRKKDF